MHFDDSQLSEFVSITSASPDTAQKYLSRFDTFEAAVESYLDEPNSSPLRAPDIPYSDILIPSPAKKSLIHNTTDNQQSFRYQIQEQENAIKGGGVDQSRLSAILEPCVYSLKTTLDCAKKRAVLARRFLLVSVFDPNALVCAGQNRDVWANADITTLVKERLLFLQLRDSSKEGREFAQIYPRYADWPHVALVDPRTGENMKQWEGKDAGNAEFLHDKISQLLSRHSNPDFGGQKIQKKRRFEQILDKTEDEQIAIAIAASMKGAKSKAKKRRDELVDESDDEDDEPPIDNSDFESVDGDSEEDEFDPDTAEEHCQNEEFATTATECPPSTAADESLPVENPPVAKNIAIVVRTPKQEKLRYELRSCVDCSVLRAKIENDGYPLDSFELVRAYPKEKIDLTRGKTLDCAGIHHHDLFHVQLKM